MGSVFYSLGHWGQTQVLGHGNKGHYFSWAIFLDLKVILISSWVMILFTEMKNGTRRALEEVSQLSQFGLASLRQL